MFNHILLSLSTASHFCTQTLKGMNCHKYPFVPSQVSHPSNSLALVSKLSVILTIISDIVMHEWSTIGMTDVTDMTA